jgi:hypothetical protein
MPPLDVAEVIRLILAMSRKFSDTDHLGQHLRPSVFAFFCTFVPFPIAWILLTLPFPLFEIGFCATALSPGRKSVFTLLD